MAENYFKNLFTTVHTNNANMEVVLDSVDRRVTTDMKHILLQPYTTGEVKRALFQIHPSKSHGPDGKSPFCFQKYWHIVVPAITEAILSILNLGHMLHKMNYTHIMLIPKKKKNPQYLSEFHPIILGNVISCIHYKVLANRLKIILPKIISNAYNAFVLDRLITNNTIVAFEVLHKMQNHWRGKKG